MCLAVPARVFEANRDVAKADISQGIVREVDFVAVEAWDGEHDLVLAGHVIQTIGTEADEENLRLERNPQV